MHLRHLEVIDALLRHGSVSTAAEWLGLANVDVEQRLAECEQSSGVLWFSRSRGRLQPTPDLLALQPALQPLGEHLEQVRRQALNVREQQAQPVSVMCSEALVASVLAPAIATLRRRFPGTPCQLASSALPGLSEALLLHRCDLALALEPAEHPALHSTALASGKLHLIAPRGWLAPRQRHISLTALAGQSLVALEHPDGPGQLLEQRLRKLAPPPRVQVRVHNHALLQALVAAGEGLALVDPFSAEAAQAAGLDTCPLSPTIDVHVYALTRQGYELPPMLQALIDLVASSGKPQAARS